MVVEGRVLTDTVSDVTLSCEIYGYPRDSSPPVWTSSVWTRDELQSVRFTTTVTNAGLLNGSSISTTERVVSQLTISNVNERDLGEYTCSVQGNSTTTTPIIVGAGIAIEDVFICMFHFLIFFLFFEIVEPIQVGCDSGKRVNMHHL